MLIGIHTVLYSTTLSYTPSYFPTLQYFPTVLVIAVMVSLAVGVLTYYTIKRRVPSEVEGTETEVLPQPIQCTTEGVLSLFDDYQSLFDQPITTTKDIHVTSGETLYYLILGEVEVLYQGEVLLTKTKNYFVYLTQWVLTPSLKPSITFIIKAKSMLYQVTNSSDERVRQVLLSRFFRGTLYTYIHYSTSDTSLDILTIPPLTSSPPSTPPQIYSHILTHTLIPRTLKSLKIVTQIEHFHGNSMYYLLSGEGTITYMGEKKTKIFKNNLIGTLNRASSLNLKRQVKGEFTALQILLHPSPILPLKSLIPIAQEYLKTPSPLLLLTDALIDWRILRPGEVLTPTLPSPSIKLITNGYFQKNPNPKYFGISHSILFEKEAILRSTGDTSTPSTPPTLLTSIRTSEVIEVPPEYITIIIKRFNNLSVDLYKRILKRVGVEEELNQPSIITFITNDSQQTQIEVFTHYLGIEIDKNDRCINISYKYLDKYMNGELSTSMGVLSLLSFFSFVQEEYKYVLIVVTEESPSEFVRASIGVSEIMFYLRAVWGGRTVGGGSIGSRRSTGDSWAQWSVGWWWEWWGSTRSSTSTGQPNTGTVPNTQPNTNPNTGTNTQPNTNPNTSTVPNTNTGTVPNTSTVSTHSTDTVPNTGTVPNTPPHSTDTVLHSIDTVWCKVDTVILHRDGKRNVSSGRYFGQRHHVEFPSIDVPVHAIKHIPSLHSTTRRTHCTTTTPTPPTLPTFPLEDLKRFLRTLKGSNVGLVLGGGGARGIAHIGVIQSLEEAGIPIDAIGGTSMGAFVGALYAERGSNKDAFIKSKRLAMLIGSVWRVLLDITYPICSMFTGKGFNWGLQKIFKNRRIEDLWLPYYCVTTDIGAFEEKVHRSGLVWRYVRASMGLAGYVPPLCDKGSFLLDGGYMNNVPVDAMRLMGIRHIIAVDVGSEVETNYHDYGDSINGFYILFQKLFGTKRYLSLTEIQYRLAYITSAHKERTIRSDVNIKYIRPDLAGYKTMNFRHFDEIVAQGYQNGKKMVNEWRKNGELQELIGEYRGSSGV